MGILGELWVKLGLKNDDLNKGIGDSKKQVSGFANYVKKLGGMITAAFSIKQIVQFTHEAANLSNKAKGIRLAFEKLGDPTLLNNLRKATQGTVDDLQLMQRAVQAKNFNIPIQNLATYLEFATKRARQTGQSVDYLVDSIVTGLGRESVLILDNLGFSAKEIRDRMKEGGSMADAVSEIIKKQMKEAAEETDNAALATERLTAAWTNFAVAFGEITSPVWNKIKTMGAELLEGVTKVLNAEGFSKRDKFSMLFGGVFGTDRYYKNWSKLMLQEKQKEIEAQKQAEINAEKEAQKQAELAAEKAKLQAQEEAKRKSQIITYLKEEISAKEQLRDLSANEDEIRQLNDEIAAMKERLKILQMSTEEYKKYRNEQMKPIPEMQSGLSGIFDTKYLEENTNKGAKILDEAAKQWKSKTIELNGEAIAQQQVTLEAINMLNGAINAGVTASLSELANVIGGVENANVGSVISALLSPLADACISAGMLIMTTGKGIEAMRDGLISFFGGNAIAAGAAMMAIGVAAKAGLAAIGKNAASGGYSNQSVTSYSGGYGVNTANYSQSANDYNLVTTLKGQDILLAIQRTENNNRR